MGSFDEFPYSNTEYSYCFTPPALPLKPHPAATIIETENSA